MLYIDDEIGLAQFLETNKDCSLAGFDIETVARGVGGSALDPHTSTIALMQFNTGHDIYLIDVLAVPMPSLLSWMQGPRTLIVHNALFEYTQLRASYGVRMSNLHCTEQMARLLANATGSKMGETLGYRLGDLVRDICGVHIAKQEATSNWGRRPLTQAQLTYAAEDVQYLLEIYQTLHTAITQPFPNLGMADVFAREMKLIEVFGEMRYVGMPVARGIFNPLRKAAEQELLAVRVEVCKRLGLELSYHFARPPAPTKKAQTQLGNAIFMRKHLSEILGVELADTRSETLKKLADTYVKAPEPEEDEEDEEEDDLPTGLTKEGLEIITLLQRDKKLQKYLTINYDSYVNIHGCICSRLNSNRAATGRTGSSQPNQQNVDSRLFQTIEDDGTAFTSNCKTEAMDYLLQRPPQ